MSEENTSQIYRINIIIPHKTDRLSEECATRDIRVSARNDRYLDNIAGSCGRVCRREAAAAKKRSRRRQMESYCAYVHACVRARARTRGRAPSRRSLCARNMRPMQMGLLSPGGIAGARLDASRIRTVVMTALTIAFAVDDRPRPAPSSRVSVFESQRRAHFSTPGRE